MTFTAVVATLWTFPLVGFAVDEPFYGPFDVVDALVMLVGGALGSLFWVLWSITLVVAVVRRWWPLTHLLLLLVSLTVGSMHYSVCAGYIEDRDAWSKMEQKP
jgi:hypothetical protein